jgi:hypothetical protein
VAFPSVAGTPAGTSDTSSTSFTVALPAGIVAGELLLIFMAHDENGVLSTITQSSGPTFTQIDNAVNGTVVRGQIWARLATGGEANPVFSSTNSQDVACVAIRVQNHGVTDVSTDIVKGTAATGADAAPDPPNCNPGTVQDFLWLEYFAADDDDDTATYWSANYSAVLQQQSASSTSSCLCAVASRQLNASSENPGVMAMAATEEWVAQTIAIKPITEKTHTTDSLLKATLDKTHTTDSLLKATFEKTHATDSLLKATVDKTHTTDSLLKAALDKTHATDSLLKVALDKTHLTDSLLKATSDKTHSTDSLLKATQDKTHPTDSLLKSSSDKTHTTDSFLAVGAASVSHTTDSLLKAAIDKTHLTDSLLKTASDKTHATDSLLKATPTQTHSSDSLLKATADRQHQTDSLLRAALERAHSSDSLLRAILDRAHLTDSLLRATADRPHLTDSLLYILVQRAHSTDALLKASQAPQHSTDALLKATTVRAHSTDSYLVPQPGTLTNVSILVRPVTKDGANVDFIVCVFDGFSFFDADVDPVCNVYRYSASGALLVHAMPILSKRAGTPGLYDGVFTARSLPVGSAPDVYLLTADVTIGADARRWSGVTMSLARHS